MVNDVASIPRVHKLQHLLSCLEGDAAQAFKNTKVIGANFDVVWNQLLQRYDRTRARLETHFFHMISAPHAKRTAADLTQLIDMMRESIRALEDMQRPTDYWDDWFVYLTASKLDKATREDWEKSIENNDDFPVFEDIADFLERRAHSLRTAQGSERPSASVTKSTTTKKSVSIYTTPTTTSGSTKPQLACAFCSENHFPSKCPKFLTMNLQERLSLVQSKNLCNNCLKSGHFSDKCKSPFRCQTCQGTHHTKLHREQAATHDATADQSSSKQPLGSQPSTTKVLLASKASPAVLLATAHVILQSPQGHRMTARALIDPAAESSFVTEHVAQCLYLPGRSVNVSITGVGGTTAKVSRREVECILQSKIQPDFALPVTALVLKKLTSQLPSTPIARQQWDHLQGIQLADPHYTTPGRIDAILAADVYAAIYQPKIKRGAPNEPVAIGSTLGWLIMGPAGHAETSTTTSATLAEIQA